MFLFFLGAPAQDRYDEAEAVGLLLEALAVQQEPSKKDPWVRYSKERNLMLVR
ncbi:Hypothetical protein FKW44_016493 [Caligus rogercresseyi]|uniref:Uncharacterized protein n=1 Tax=Caligus rogercresseyi TaxID=217165 RepID=A0A7T8H1T7_CALRO|nr:Hypothetical protein FKW44_016493 [Caligus rogercresseyi]